jgi:hypothetical protein
MSIGGIACVSLGADELRGLERPGASECLTPSGQRGVENVRIGPAELEAGGILEEAATAPAKLPHLAVDALQELIGHRDQNTSHLSEYISHISSLKSIFRAWDGAVSALGAGLARACERRRGRSLHFAR